MLRKLCQIRFSTTKYLRVKKILIFSVLAGTVDPTNSYLTLWRIRNKKSSQKPTWLIEILYSSNIIFCCRFYAWLDCHDSQLNNRSGNIFEVFYFFFHINLTFSFSLLTKVFHGLLGSILQRFFEVYFANSNSHWEEQEGTHSFRQDCNILCQKIIFKILAIFLHQKATNFDNF